jgi:DNA topoisomerase-3
VGELEEFSLKGTVILEPGWTKYDDYSKKDKILPNLSVGDVVNTNFVPTEKETTPPKHYTIETLNNYLKNPFKEEKQNIENEDDEEEYRAIFEGLELGTEATRTGIIDNAKKSKYISLTKDVYRIEKGGKYLIEQLVDMNISMDKYKTSQLGQALKQVYRGEITVNDSVEIAKKEIAEVFNTSVEKETGVFGERIGVCPLCGKDVVKGKFAYGCLGFKSGCEFRINLKILGAQIAKTQASKLLETGYTDKLKFTSKQGKEFESKLKLEKDGKIVFDFDKH